MQQLRKTDDQDQSKEALTISKQASDQVGLQKRQQRDIAEFRAWLLRNVSAENFAVLSLADEDLKKALIQSDTIVKQSIGVSQSVQKIIFKPEVKQVAVNNGGRQDFRANQNGRINFTPLLAVPLPVDETLRKTKQTVQEGRIQFRKDVANIKGHSPKALVEKAKTTIRDYDGDEIGTQDQGMTLNAINEAYAPLSYKKKKKKRYGLDR